MIFKNSPTFKYFKITAIIFCLFISFSVPKQTQALADYKVLVPLPGIGDKDGKTNLNTWLPAAFNLTVAISVAMAFVVITFGGVLYATSDAINDKGKGKQYIENALTGLLFVIGAYVILNTINPKLVKINLSIEPPKPLEAGSDIVLGGSQVNGSQYTDPQVREKLGSGFSISNPCPAGTSTGCVNMNGITDTTIAGLKALQASCKCTINITGGTEPAHSKGSAHYKGIAVDISSRNNPEITAIGKKANPNYVACEPFPVRGAGGAGQYFAASFQWEPAGAPCGSAASTGDHWHVSF